MARIRTACLVAAVGLFSVAGPLVGGCSGHDGGSSVDSRAAADVGNPSVSVNATAVDPIAAKYGVAWWEGSVQDFSAADAYGNALPPGEQRYAIVFFGHRIDGLPILSGQLVIDATYAASLAADATMVDISLIFDGSGVYGYPADPSNPLPDGDSNALLGSVIDSFSGGPSGGPSSVNPPPNPTAPSPTAPPDANAPSPTPTAPPPDAAPPSRDAAAPSADAAAPLADAAAPSPDAAAPSPSPTAPLVDAAPPSPVSSSGIGAKESMVAVLQAAQAAGMPCNNNLITAGAVAGGESSLNPHATNTNGATSGCPNGSTDNGLWQINNCYHPNVTQSCAFDPSCAASSMMQISKNGSNFNAWDAYKYGSYKAWVPMATQAYNQICNPAATTACGSNQVKPVAQSAQTLTSQAGSGSACMSGQCGSGMLTASPTNACSGSSADASPPATGKINLSQYSPSTAVAYADAHWQDGVGLCAEFASRSIIAGGAQMPIEAWVPSLLAKLSSLPFDEYNSTNTTVSGNPGDIVIYSDASGSNFCVSHSSDEYNCGHAGIVVVGGGSASTILADFHNNAHYHLAIHSILGSGGYSTFRVYHLAAGTGAACACSPCASSLVPPANNTPAPNCNDAGAPYLGIDASVMPEASSDSPIIDGSLSDGPDPYYCTEHGLANGFYCGQNIGLTPNTVYDCSNGFIFNFGTCGPGQSCVTGQQNCQ